MIRSLLTLVLISTLACTPKGEDSAATDDSAAPADDSASDSADSGGEDTAVDGATLYATHCASCHGDQGQGASGPGLERELHHTDEELVRVILEGKAEMSPVDVTEEDAYAIIAFVRELFAR